MRQPAPRKRYASMNGWAQTALLSDVSMAVLGGSLKRGTYLRASGRVLSQLCLASAVLKRYDDEGHTKPTCRWCAQIQDALYRAEQAMDDLLQNFPNRVVASCSPR